VVIETGSGYENITLGNGAGDTVTAQYQYYSKITAGNGAGDTVNAQGGVADSITLGNGAGDTVNAQGSRSDGYSPYSVTLGDGAGDTVNAQVDDGGLNIALGNGARDVVNAQAGIGDTIAVGKGNNDTVFAHNSTNDNITVGDGNDTIYAGLNTTMTVGVGQDSFVFDQTTPGAIGQAAITGFNPNKDSFTFSNQLTTSVSYQDDAHGNAVITVDSAGDTITLVGVHSSELHPSDFHFADPAKNGGARSSVSFVEPNRAPCGLHF
jgi:hypothetical protein